VKKILTTWRTAPDLSRLSSSSVWNWSWSFSLLFYILRWFRVILQK